MSKAARPTKLGNGWRIRWLDHQGIRRSTVLDSYDEAERELRGRQVEADQVRAGLKPPPPIDRTFSDLVAYWREHRAPLKRSRKDDESIFCTHLLPAFRSTLVREITTQRVDEYVRAKTSLSPKTVRNHLVLLGTALKVALALGWLTTLPVITKPRLDPDDEVRQPWLETKEDIRRFLDAARLEPEPMPFVLYATALYTGLRAGELAGLRWDDVDLTRRTIQVRRSYSGKTKTLASRRHVPIVDALLPVLNDWAARSVASDEGLVFANCAGRMLDQSARVFQEGLHRVLDRAGFTRPKDGRRRHVIHFHSLRHTFACHWRLNGGALDELVRVLGHTSRAMTEVYANIGGYHRPEHFALFAAE